MTDRKWISIGAALTVLLLLLIPLSSLTAQSSGIGEDCISFDANRAEVRRYSSSWKIVVGSLWLLDFGNSEAEARKVLEIIRHYGLNRQCFVGRPDPSLEYYLADGQAPAGSLPGEDCIRFDPARLQVITAGGRWKIAEGNHWLLDFGGSRSEAEKALQIILHHGFTSICYVGRPQPSFTYLRRDGGGQASGTPAAAAKPGTAAAGAPEVAVYGQSSCGRCTAMMRSLQQANIAATFHDINTDASRRSEMWEHIRREHPGVRNVGIPVVRIDTAILINPSFQEVRAKLGGTPAPSDAPGASGTSSWRESDYSRYDHNSFFDFPPAREPIRLNSIDYPLLQAALFFETNRERVRAGRSPLRYHSGCAAAAQMHAEDMAAGRFFSHVNPKDPSKRSLEDRVARFDIRWNWIAENINQGPGEGSYVEVARRYVDSWMNSSGHRTNMLNRSATHMGTGAYNAGSKYTDLYFDAVQVFAQIRE